MRKLLWIILVGFLAGFGGALVGFKYVIQPRIAEVRSEPVYNQIAFDTPTVRHAPVSSPPASAPAVDFSDAAARATASVVFINSISQGVSMSYWDWFFGEGGSQTQVSSGSGVIFTSDGYIITNNHVIAQAQRIEVNYNKRVYPAEVVGTDPGTDLAVIKIEATGLPAITLGSSENLQVGEWVIAVGNPFTLSSTVTAGIVSAKGRRIGILRDNFPIESFIQTDAAINPGNSGGALVNKSGQLVGINTAILSRTGSYTGYAFAVPVDIVRKVFDDIVKYGVVQKAFLGANVTDYDYATARKYDLTTNVDEFKGVLLERLERDGPASKAGLKLGDVITHINNKAVDTQSEFEEELSYRYPGDRITLTYLRDGKKGTTSLTLVNRNGTEEVIRRKIVSALGAQMEATDEGVKVFKLSDSSVLKRIGVTENFTIIEINRERINDPKEVIDIFNNFRGRGYIFGINSSRQRVQIPFIIR